VNAVVLVGVIAYYPQIPAPAWSLRLASGLILAGDLGNVIDRLRSAARLAHEASSFWKALPGASVTDMFDFKVWPVFNVADMSLVAGIIIVGWVMWRIESRSRPASEPVVTEDAQSASDDCGPQ
jgi:signal peptidase II